MTGISPHTRLPLLRFVRWFNGALYPEHSFEVPVGARLLLGRTDPGTNVFPDIDVTMWTQRVPTPAGALFSIHRRHCYISRDEDGRVMIEDYPEHAGDTLVAKAGDAMFHAIPAWRAEGGGNAGSGLELQVGDRILIGQGEGMLIFQLVGGR